MAVSLQVAFLLLLLTLSLPAVHTNRPLCGADLVHTLRLVCGERGFYTPQRRGTDSLLGFLSQKASSAAGLGRLAESYSITDQMKVTEKRGIVEQCCTNICTLAQLDLYCN